MTGHPPLSSVGCLEAEPWLEEVPGGTSYVLVSGSSLIIVSWLPSVKQFSSAMFFHCDASAWKPAYHGMNFPNYQPK